MCAHTAGTLVSPYKFMVQIYYRPQGKVMFSEACIILSTGGALLRERDPRLDRDPPRTATTPLPETSMGRETPGRNMGPDRK